MTFISEIAHRLLGRIETTEEGATMVEYGLMVALIAVVAMVGATALGTSVNGVFSSIAGTIGGA